MSSSSSFASFTPATSSNVTLLFDPAYFFAGLLIKVIPSLAEPLAGRSMKLIIIIKITNGKNIVSKVTHQLLPKLFTYFISIPWFANP